MYINKVDIYLLKVLDVRISILKVPLGRLSYNYINTPAAIV